MMEHWQKLTARFNALAPRERVLVFVAVLLGTVLVFHTTALDPLLAQKKRLAAQLAETRQNLKVADELTSLQVTAADPSAIKRSYRDALRKQLAQIDQDIQGLQKGLVPPERMAKLLEEMLARGHGLQLVSLRTLPAQRFESPGKPAPAAKPAAQGAKPPAVENERSIFQHSYEIVLQGSYVDLHDYLARLEQLPWQMFWGRISLDAEQHPRLRVTLTVHTLSLSKAWLIV
jgi:MSHA biogenesis protein MshJ